MGLKPPDILNSDEQYLKIWEIEQDHVRTRWTIATFFFSISFAILGFSFQPQLTHSSILALRLCGLVVYWFGYLLFLHFYKYDIYLRRYMAKMETFNQTSIRLHPPSRMGRRLRTIHLLAIFGIMYLCGILLLFLLKI